MSVAKLCLKAISTLARTGDLDTIVTIGGILRTFPRLVALMQPDSSWAANWQRISMLQLMIPRP